jgi:low temperature requirement protein LtrA
MRLALISQWLRAARQDPARRKTCLRYAGYLAVVQLGWIAVLFIQADVLTTFLMIAPLYVLELATPYAAERNATTPWHAHHIAERYGLLAIIALGECLIGAVETLRAIVANHGWSVDAALVGFGGTALAFGMWWIYFILPCGGILARHRERSFGWGYGHIVLFGALVAVGAGLHAAAFYLEHHSVLGTTGTVLTVAIPVALYVLSIYVLYYQISRVFDPFHLLLLAGTALVAVASVAMAAAGAPMVWCLAVLALTPWVTVVGYETIGYRHGEESLARL